MGIIVEKTNLEEVLLIKPLVFEDHRGTNTEIYNINDYHKNSINIHFVRDHISTSSKDVLRGIHYDDKTWKLIQCMYGKIYFVVVNMKQNSSQYLQWQSFILTDRNRNQVLVPPNFGNAHLILSEECIFHYKMSEYYDPDNECGVRWNDPKVDIFWPISNPITSQKDSQTSYL